MQARAAQLVSPQGERRKLSPRAQPTHSGGVVMAEYLTRLRNGTEVRVYPLEAADFSAACRLARVIARGTGPNWRATNVNVVQKFRLLPGERISDPPPHLLEESSSGSALEPLNGAARREICRVVLHGLRLAEVRGTSALGSHLVRHAQWFWTADGLVDGAYVRDAVKLDLSVLPHTEAATRALGRSELRHEHAVPRGVVRRYLQGLHDGWSDVDDDAALTEIASVLDACPPVIVTRDEDERLGGPLRAKMPNGWQFGDSPFARYIEAGLIKRFDDLRFPPNGFWPRSGRLR
ncbi:hypothetical protein E8A74_40560 [Polyangium fumosum]|uniref:Uncharacterized protein n=1 Tax=Polyangium fumosum TaxID=889272 RepID=A0A4U1IVW8_9BACT|nr:hypothetical protein E8A74_40560 [Polyangium fumosum]